MLDTILANAKNLLTLKFMIPMLTILIGTVLLIVSPPAIDDIVIKLLNTFGTDEHIVNVIKQLGGYVEPQ